MIEIKCPCCNNEVAAIPVVNGDMIEVDGSDHYVLKYGFCPKCDAKLDFIIELKPIKVSFCARLGDHNTTDWDSVDLTEE